MRLPLSPDTTHRLLLLVVLIVAAFLRFWNLKWNLPATLHPDEHIFVLHALRFGTGDLNPHFFLYGSLLMYLSFLGYGVYFVVGRLFGLFSSMEFFAIQYFLDPTWFFLIPRLISAAAGTGTVWLLYVLGRRIGSPHAGLFAAAAMALYGDHVRESHYGLSAVLGAFLVTTVFVTMLGPDRQYVVSKSRLFSAGVLAGLAVSAHMLGGIAAVILCIWILWQSRTEPITAFRSLTTAALGGAIGFFLGEPFFFLDFPNAYRQLFSSASSLFTTVYRTEEAAAFDTFVLQDVRTSLGWLGGTLAVGGAVLAVRRRLVVARILLAVAVLYIFFLSFRGYAPSRYILMIVPIMCLFFGIGAAETFAQLRARTRLPGGIVLAALALTLMAEPAVQASRIVRSFGAPDTRVLAQRWIYENVPAGSRLLVEGPDANLPRLLENAERLNDLKVAAASAGAGRTGRYKDLDKYFRYKALAAKKTREPTYWILRLKRPWWSSSEAQKEAGILNELTPPTAHVGTESIDYYQKEQGIEYFVNTNRELRTFDNPRFPSAQRFYADLRTYGKLLHVQEPGLGIVGPSVLIWRINNAKVP